MRCLTSPKKFLGGTYSQDSEEGVIVRKETFNLHLTEDMHGIGMFGILCARTKEEVPREMIRGMDVGEGGEGIRNGATFAIHVEKQVFQKGGLWVMGAMEEDASVEETAL